jgi:hypothetical protein
MTERYVVIHAGTPGDGGRNRYHYAQPHAAAWKLLCTPGRTVSGDVRVAQDATCPNCVAAASRP